MKDTFIEAVHNRFLHIQRRETFILFEYTYTDTGDTEIEIDIQSYRRREQRDRYILKICDDIFSVPDKSERIIYLRKRRYNIHRVDIIT